jgi:glycerol uptake facilitator-like aquaporin
MANLGQIFLAELIGTFIFLGVIMHVVGKKEDMGWIKIGLALAVAILLLGTVSGGKFNPAVSFMFLVANKTPISQFIIEVIAQIIGALAALGLYYGVIN